MRKKKTAKASRGQGRLYKRHAGRDYPASAPLRAPFYLRMTEGGKRRTIALTDESGAPVTDRAQAELIRERLTLPARAKDDLQRVETLASVIQGAEQRLAKAENDATPPLSISRAWKAYLTTPPGKVKPNSGPRTLADYGAYFARFEKWAAGRGLGYMADVTPKDAGEYSTTLRAETSAGTHNKHIRLLRLAYAVLMRDPENRITENPFSDIATDEKDVHQHHRRDLSPGEIKAVIEAAQGDFRLLLTVGAFTGLRFGDCCCLEWGNVDLERGIIRRLPNKTARSRDKDRATVKIGIHPYLRAELESTPTEQRRGFVFPEIQPIYADPASRPGITQKLQRLFEQCGIETHKPGTGEGTGKRAVVDVGFHSLRHSFVSRLAESGIPQATVQRMAGHSNPRMTEIYSHVGDAQAVHAANTLPALADGTQATRREPLPSWARELIESQTAKTWRAIRAELLEGVR